MRRNEPNVRSFCSRNILSTSSDKVGDTHTEPIGYT